VRAETDVTLFAGITGDFSDTHVRENPAPPTSSTRRRRSIAKVKMVNQHGETVAVADHIMRWAKKLSSADN
jgi:hypothetical protein